MNDQGLSDGFALRLRLSHEAKVRAATDRRTDAGEWLSSHVWFLRNVGHPDDLATAREVLSLPAWEESGDLAGWLEKMEAEGRRILADLERVGWTYAREAVGKGSLEPIRTHPVHGGGRGNKTHYLSSLVWTLCYAKEEAERDKLRKSGKPLPRQPWRVPYGDTFRATIAADLDGLVPPEYLTDARIKRAVNSWLKTDGARPPWLPPAENGD